MLSPLQNKLLIMLDWFHNYCKDNNIKYYIAGGTVIGAARHQGFIPWDDDIDIVLPRDDYERLLRLFTKKIDHYVLESPYSGANDYLYSFSKLYDTNTTLIERKQKEIKRGIYIDIFPLDGIGNTQADVNHNFSKYYKLYSLFLARTCAVRSGRSKIKNLSVILAQLIPSFIINNSRLAKTIDEIASKYGSDMKYVGNLMGAYGKKEIVKKELFGSPTLYKFESIEVFGPEKIDEYLTYIYGDWRKLPPLEKQKSAHDYILLDLDKPYN